MPQFTVETRRLLEVKRVTIPIPVESRVGYIWDLLAGRGISPVLIHILNAERNPHGPLDRNEEVFEGDCIIVYLQDTATLGAQLPAPAPSDFYAVILFTTVTDISSLVYPLSGSLQVGDLGNIVPCGEEDMVVALLHDGKLADPSQPIQPDDVLTHVVMAQHICADPGFFDRDDMLT